MSTGELMAEAWGRKEFFLETSGSFCCAISCQQDSIDRVTDVGMFSVTIGVTNIEGEDFQQVKATVDTGAHYSLIPSWILKKVGVKPYKTESLEMADGSVKEYPVGLALMTYDGREEVCQVVFGDDTEPLLGALALEEFGLVVDPVGQKLLPRRLRGRPF